MNDQLNENSLLQLLMQSEEYEDALDILHPEDEIEDDLTRQKSLRFTSSKLAIVVGHTRRGPGAEGANPISSCEYFWNSKLAKLIKSQASANNIECGIFYRDGIGIKGAYKKVNLWHADSCIELHFNAYDGKVIGTETLYGLYSPSKDWASSIQDAMVGLYDRTGKPDRGIKQRIIGERGGKSVNQLDTIPSCLIEPYFGDVSSEAILADSYLLDLAKVLVDTHKHNFG